MKKKKSPLARAEGCFFFFLFLLQGWVCLHIDLPFTPLPLSWYGFFGAALTSSLTLSHLDPLPTPEQQTQTADPRLASPSIFFFFFFLRTLIVSPSSNYYAELLSWLSLVARYYFDVHSGCSMDSCISYVEGPISGDSGADSIPFSCLFGPRIPFRHLLNGVKKCIVTHPKVK